MLEINEILKDIGSVTMGQKELDHVLAQPLLARIATAGADGQPHVVPVWFQWDGEHMYIETGLGFRKARNLEENPQCAISVDDTQGGLRFWGIFMQGEAELITEPENWVRDMVRHIYGKYLGEEGIQAPTPQLMINNDHVIIKFRPRKITVWNDTRHAIAPIG
jgi:PPOX class probable F420-dependent enzyme